MTAVDWAMPPVPCLAECPIGLDDDGHHVCEKAEGHPYAPHGHDEWLWHRCHCGVVFKLAQDVGPDDEAHEPTAISDSDIDGRGPVVGVSAEAFDALAGEADENAEPVDGEGVHSGPHGAAEGDWAVRVQPLGSTYPDAEPVFGLDAIERMRKTIERIAAERDHWRAVAARLHEAAEPVQWPELGLDPSGERGAVWFMSQEEHSRLTNEMSELRAERDEARAELSAVERSEDARLALAEAEVQRRVDLTRVVAYVVHTGQDGVVLTFDPAEVEFVFRAEDGGET